MSKRTKTFTYPEELFYLLAAFDSDDLPDDSWYQLLHDAVAFYNGKHSTNFEPNATVQAYLAWSSSPLKSNSEPISVDFT